MSKKDIPIEEYFRYHPPIPGSDRVRKHDRINALALEFAKAIDVEIEDEVTKQYAIFAVQQARMFANQGVTVDEIRQNIQGD
jgi:hypothetical protein